MFLKKWLMVSQNFYFPPTRLAPVVDFRSGVQCWVGSVLVLFVMKMNEKQRRDILQTDFMFLLKMDVSSIQKKCQRSLFCLCRCPVNSVISSMRASSILWKTLWVFAGLLQCIPVRQRMCCQSTQTWICSSQQVLTSGTELQGPAPAQRYLLSINLKQGKNLIIRDKRSGRSTANPWRSTASLCSYCADISAGLGWKSPDKEIPYQFCFSRPSKECSPGVLSHGFGGKTRPLAERCTCEAYSSCWSPCLWQRGTGNVYLCMKAGLV